MFLKQLYKHNRWFFVLMVLFIIGQAFINIKRGAVVSPFYHYGMYSKAMVPADNYPVFEVTVNGKLLQGKSFSPWRWDKIMQPLVYYTDLGESNQLYSNEVKRIFGRVGLPASENHFGQAVDRATFLNWYKTYLSGIVGSKVISVDVNLRQYRFNGKALQPTDTLHLL